MSSFSNMMINELIRHRISTLIHMMNNHHLIEREITGKIINFYSTNEDINIDKIYKQIPSNWSKTYSNFQS